MNNSMPTPAVVNSPLLVPAGEDRFTTIKTLGVSSVAYKVTSQESKDLFMMEITLRQKGGPEKHKHYFQDEWFYIVEGEFLIEAGDRLMRLKVGDSLFVPRQTPHVWAFVGETQGRILISASPACKLEEFFENASKNNAPPGSDQSQWQPYDLEWIGPPLKID